METALSPRELKTWAWLSKATGFSASYCKKVVQGSRSQQSKGGKQIIEKYNELQKIVENGNNTYAGV